MDQNIDIFEESKKAVLTKEDFYSFRKNINSLENDEIIKGFAEYKIREDDNYYNIQVSLGLSKKDNKYIFEKLKDKDNEWIRRLINFKIFGVVDEIYEDSIFNIAEDFDDLEEFLTAVIG
jgi:hypothetical protein